MITIFLRGGGKRKRQKNERKCEMGLKKFFSVLYCSLRQWALKEKGISGSNLHLHDSICLVCETAVIGLPSHLLMCLVFNNMVLQEHLGNNLSNSER